MNRVVRHLLSYLSAVGYLVAITWGPAWHDHHGCCSHVPIEEAAVSPEHPHNNCCSHHHTYCCDGTSHSTELPSQPCPPGHDDNCVVCQTLAHPPLVAPVLAIVDDSHPVPAWVDAAGPSFAAAHSTAYDSRGPPAV